MALTPDEIAHRAFTPSVDGYHQGEVRSFLERVASQLENLLAALPEGRSELAELATALRDHEPRLTTLNDRLHGVLAELTDATAAVRETQAEAETYLIAAKELATEHAAATLPGRAGTDDEEPDPATVRLLAEHRSLLEILSNEHRAVAAQLDSLATEHQAVTAQLDTARKLTAEQREAAEHIATAGQQQSDQLDTTGRLVDRHAATLAAGGRLVAKLSEVNARPVAAPAPAPVTHTPRSESPPPQLPLPESPARPSTPDSTRGTVAESAATPSASSGKSSSVEALSLLGSDLHDQPLFSDNANDLLDGVLDDVMGNLTDEGDPK